MTTSCKNIMLGTAGHVDHGKTALVKLLTGCETDTLAVEKQRGLTIELGFAPCQMADQRIVGIVDVPGHVSFIRNMVAGAQGVDVVILVVAADDGVMPQTREHLDILTLLGVRHGLVALTKVDLVDDELREMAVDDVSSFVAGTFLEGAAICPISNVTGEGFNGFFAALDEAVGQCQARPVSGLFRLWIERSFSVRGFGQVVSGIPTSGQLRSGDRLRLLPGGQTARVRGLEVYGRDAEVGRAGECVAMNLADADSQSTERGGVVCEGDSFESVTIAEAELHLLGHTPRPLRSHVEVHLHVGTAHVTARLALLEGGQLEPGRIGFVQLLLATPLPVAAGDRFLVRSSMPGHGEQGLTTIGGGRILGTSNARLRRRRERNVEMLGARKRAIDDPQAWCELHLAEANQPLGSGPLAQRAQMPAAEMDALLEQSLRKGSVVDVGGGLFAHRDAVANLAGRVLAALADFHAGNPMRLGMARDDLTKVLDVPGNWLDLALRQLVEQGNVVLRGEVFAAADHKSPVNEQDVELSRRVEATLRQARLAPPHLTTLATDFGIGGDRLDTMIRFLADQGCVIVLDGGVVMHREAVGSARQAVLDLFADKQSFTTAEYRDALGASRKYVIPLLDHFDRTRLTVRSGSRRTPGAMAKREGSP